MLSLTTNPHVRKQKCLRRTKAVKTKVASKISRATKVVNRAAGSRVAKNPASSSKVVNTAASRVAASPAVSRTSR